MSKINLKNFLLSESFDSIDLSEDIMCFNGHNYITERAIEQYKNNYNISSDSRALYEIKSNYDLYDLQVLNEVNAVETVLNSYGGGSVSLFMDLVTNKIVEIVSKKGKDYTISQLENITEKYRRILKDIKEEIDNVRNYKEDQKQKKIFKCSVLVNFAVKMLFIAFTYVLNVFPKGGFKEIAKGNGKEVKNKMLYKYEYLKKTSLPFNFKILNDFYYISQSLLDTIVTYNNYLKILDDYKTKYEKIINNYEITIDNLKLLRDKKRG